MAVFSIAAPRVLSGQSAVERASLDHFRDSLRATRDTGILRRLEREQKAAVKARGSDAMARLRLGFLELRRGEVLADRGRFGDAESSFDRVAMLRPNWPITFTARGLARLNEADNETVARRILPSIIVGDRVADAADDFAHAAELDTLYADGLVQLSSIALRYRHSAQLRAALLALRQVAPLAVSRNRDVRLARVRIELAVGSVDSAGRIAGALLADNPSDPAALIEAGRATLAGLENRAAVAGRDAPGAESWYRGMTLADSATARYYRSDLLFVLPDSVMRQFDASGGEARTQVLRRFFEFHDPGSLGTASERLAEHFLRLDRARSNFVIHSDVYSADVAMPFDPTGRELDERALVWVLHGPPANRTYLNLTGGPKNESWQYRQSDGSELLFHFVKTDDSVGYRRVASLMDILALTRPAQATGQGNMKEKTARGEAIETYGAGWTAQMAQDILYSRENTSPTYARMLSEGKKGAAALQAAERATGDSSIAMGETSALRYELPLEAHVQAIAVGPGTDGATLQVAFGIPGSSLYSPPGEGPVVYPVRMRLRVVRGSEVIVNVDTLRRFVSRQPIPDEGVLFGRLPLRVPPGEYQVFVVMETTGRGVVLEPQTVRVAAASTPTIDLSDLAIGARSVKLPWRTPSGDTAWMNPLHQFRNREPMQLYFEVLGVPAGGAYKGALAIFRTGENRPQVQLGFNATSTGSPDAIHREIDLGRLGTGSYLLQVTVSTPSGRDVVRRREFTVVK